MDAKRIELLNRIRATEFMLLELQLYLDSHPQDSRAVMEYNCYVQQVLALKEQYHRLYSMIMPYQPSKYPWSWIHEPWPWEQDSPRAKEEYDNVAI